MPAWGQENGGELSDQQIIELVLMLQHVDWNRVFNAAVEASGGYPTVPPSPESTSTAAAATGTQAPASGDNAAASGVPSSGITIAMHDIYFDPTTFTLPADTAVTIHLVNDGAAIHNFELPGHDVSIDLDPGQSADLEIPALPAGEYTFECNIPGHKEAGMVGTLTVSADAKLPENAGAAAAPAEGTAAPAEETAGASADAAAPALTVEAVDIAFKPTELSVKANTPTALTITNTGAAVHDFSIDELGIKVDLNPGESKTIEINAPAGTYQYYCSIPGHKEAGMVGTLKSE